MGEPVQGVAFLAPDLYDVEDDGEVECPVEAWCREHGIPPIPDPPPGIILDRAHLRRDDPPASTNEPPYIRREAASGRS